MNVPVKYYLYMGASIVLSATAQLAMKAGMLLLSASEPAAIPIFLMSHPAALLWIIAGLTSYAISMLFWMSAMARLELSFAYPMLSLSYVLVYVMAANWALLGEHFSTGRSIGIAIVMLGVLLVSQSEPDRLDASGNKP